MGYQAYVNFHNKSIPYLKLNSCESKGEIWLNNVILLIQLFSED